MEAEFVAVRCILKRDNVKKCDRLLGAIDKNLAGSETVFRCPTCQTLLLVRHTSNGNLFFTVMDNAKDLLDVESGISLKEGVLV